MATIRKEDTKFGVHLLVVIFGITSWSIMNGLWVELPILVTNLPEGWTLPSYLTIITQFGNIGLIVFSLIAYFKPTAKLETGASFVIVTALTLCAFLYAFFWRETAYVAGGKYSVALLGLTFSQSVFAATTSIAYITFMAHLKARYIASVYIGMGFSGLIPALAALGQGYANVRCVDLSDLTVDSVVNRSQGLSSSTWNLTNFGGNVTDNNHTHVRHNSSLQAVNEEPAFSVQGFFLLLFSVGVLSILSLVMLVYHPYCKTEHVDTDKEEDSQLMRSGSKQESKSATNNRTAKGHNTINKRTIENVEDPKLAIKYSNETIKPINNNKQSLNITDVNETLKYSADSSKYEYSNSREATNITIQYKPPELSTQSDIADNSMIINSEKHRLQDVTSTDNGYNEGNDVDVKENEECELKSDKQGQLTMLESWFLLFLLVWINALQTSFLLAIQVYSSLPYGLQFYNAATKAENIVEPIASFLTFWITASTTTAISGLTFLGTLFTAYIITVAAMSPNPFLVNETAGGVLVVAAWVMCSLLMGFTKVSIASVMRGQGRVSLMWTGGSTQIGALLGAILAYVLINYLKLFKDEPWCR